MNTKVAHINSLHQSVYADERGMGRGRTSKNSDVKSSQCCNIIIIRLFISYYATMSCQRVGVLLLNLSIVGVL